MFKKIFCNRISSSLGVNQGRFLPRPVTATSNMSSQIEESKGPAVPNAADHGIAYSSIADGPNDLREGPIISVEADSETGDDESDANRPIVNMNADERRQSHLLDGMAMPAICEDLSIMEASVMESSMIHSSD